VLAISAVTTAGELVLAQVMCLVLSIPAVTTAAGEPVLANVMFFVLAMSAVT
jgi:hypothetical protein